MPSNNVTPAPRRLSAQQLPAGLTFQSILEATVNILAETVALPLPSASLGLCNDITRPLLELFLCESPEG